MSPTSYQTAPPRVASSMLPETTASTKSTEWFRASIARREINLPENS